MRDIIRKKQDLTDLSWDEKAVTSGTGGTFLKSRSTSSRRTVYYKLSCYDSYRGIYGHESVNELIASRLLDTLSIPHVPYKLVHADVFINGVCYETWLSESCDYRVPGERRQPFDGFYELYREENEIPLDFAIRRGWATEIQQMMAFDYLIANRDRHGANFEVIYRNGNVEFSPLFDHGLSLIYSCYENEEAARSFDSGKDIQANNFIGTRSLEENLRFLPRGLFTDAINFEDTVHSVFNDLEGILPQAHREKIEEMLFLRWGHLVNLGLVGRD